MAGRVVAAGMLVLVAATAVPAATLPPHEPLRILIVSDEVNPHGLPPASLTQPGELSAAFTTPGNGLNLDAGPNAVLEIDTNQIELATAQLSLARDDPAAYDVLVYFAHRIPDNGNDPNGRQAAFVAAVEAFLVAGGGVVSFHHGSYQTPGKEGIQDVIGGTATGSVPWNTVDGQNVIDVAPGHFVTTNGVAYTGTVTYADPGRGVPADDYSFFNNTPDERYPSFEINPSAEQVEVLFGSDYVQGGTTHLLGFTHRRAAWQGVVVAYQPGEYQPNALDVTGNNFQILANALVYAADALLPEDPLLTLTSGPGASDVTLDWIGGQGPYTIFRSTNAATTTDAANEQGTTPAPPWIDTPPPTPITFYRVLDTP